MYKTIKYLYDKALLNYSCFDLIVLFGVTIIANRFYSIIALIFSFTIQSFQMFSGIKWRPLKPKLAFYSGIRKSMLQFMTICCNAIAFKLIYITAFSDNLTNQKITLILKVILVLIIIPNFTNSYLKWETVRKI